MGVKPSDSETIPLCSEHHREQHSQGERKFHGDMDKIRDLSRFIWENSGDWPLCVKRTREYFLSVKRET